MPDGRGVAIRADCEASLEALGGLPIDLYLLHAPDPRTTWATSVRALATLLEAGLVRRIGLSNVNRRQLDEALELAPISAVEVSLSLLDDEPLRGGVVARCEERGLAVIAHSPLGGVSRAGALARDAALVEEATRLGATPHELALAALLDAHPSIVAIPGARRGPALLQRRGEPALVVAEVVVVQPVRPRGVEHGDARLHRRADGVERARLVPLRIRGEPHAPQADAQFLRVEPGRHRVRSVDRAAAPGFARTRCRRQARLCVSTRGSPPQCGGTTG